MVHTSGNLKHHIRTAYGDSENNQGHQNWAREQSQTTDMGSG